MESQELWGHRWDPKNPDTFRPLIVWLCFSRRLWDAKRKWGLGPWQPRSGERRPRGAVHKAVQSAWYTIVNFACVGGTLWCLLLFCFGFVLKSMGKTKCCPASLEHSCSQIVISGLDLGGEVDRCILSESQILSGRNNKQRNGNYVSWAKWGLKTLTPVKCVCNTLFLCHKAKEVDPPFIFVPSFRWRNKDLWSLVPWTGCSVSSNWTGSGMLVCF